MIAYMDTEKHEQVFSYHKMTVLVHLTDNRHELSVVVAESNPKHIFWVPTHLMVYSSIEWTFNKILAWKAAGVMLSFKEC